MELAEIPSSEEERLICLRNLNILDTLPEERFDRLTRLAKRLFGVPIALVSLVDEDRQWFKSRQGLDIEETPRDISFCGHAVYKRATLVVNDTTKDPRFSDNPLVVGDAHIRFYAGCPLHSIDGHILGTLCIIDTEPRAFSAEDQDSLEDLAMMAQQELAALQLATVDELTGISNRRGFQMLAEKSLSYCTRHGIEVSFAFIDLDKFKEINDQYGHAEGDKVLVVFANMLKECFRESDSFARLGGDEFVVLLTQAEKKCAEKVLLKLQEAVADYNSISGNPYTLSFTCGLVEYNRFRHTSIDMLLADGDEKMYKNKLAHQF